MKNVCERRRWAVAVLLLALGIAAQADDPGPLDGGRWTKKSYAIEGGWSLDQRDDGRYLVLDDEFKTRKAPDLKVFLSKTPLDRLNDKNAVTGSLLLGALSSNEGRQEFGIPEGVSLDDYASVIIHCEKYSKLWGGATLRR